MAGINIAFASDVRSFIKGTDDIERAMDDVGDSLDDVSKDAKTAGDKIERSLSDAGKDAEKSSDKMEKSFRKDFDKVEDHAKDAGKTIGKESKEGFAKAERAADDFKGKANEATGSFKDEAKQNFAETASSFDGSMTGIADMAQSTLGGLASAIPGAGVFAGAAALAGGAFLAKWTEKTEAVKQVVSDMYDDMIESGEDYLSQAYIQEAYWAILKGESTLLTKGNLEDIAMWSRRSTEEVALAYAGNLDMVESMLASVGVEEDKFQAQLADRDFANDESARAALAHLGAIRDGLDEAKDRTIAATTEVINGRDAWNAWGTSATEEQKRVQDAYGAIRTEHSGLVSEIENTPSPVIRPTLDTAALDSQYNTWQRKTRTIIVDGIVRGRVGVPYS